MTALAKTRARPGARVVGFSASVSALAFAGALWLSFPVLAAPKASPHDRLMGQCVDQGGEITIKNGVELCCARIPNPAPNGPKGYCVVCRPPGSNDCDMNYTMRPATGGAATVNPGGALAK